MGNEASKQEKVRKKKIKLEWKKNKNNQIFLFVGDTKCGKTSLIDNIVSSFSKIEKSEQKDLIQNEYILKSFTVNEISLTGTNDTISSHDKAAVYDNMNVEKQAQLNYFIHDSHNPIIKSLPLLIFGYIHQNKINELYDITIPTDIIQLISQFMSKTILLSHKIINKKNEKQICELWECSFYDRLNWTQLYQYQHLIVFVVDVSIYDEYYNDYEHGNINKLKYSLNLFESILKDNDKLNNRNLMLLFNKMDIFSDKIIKKAIPLNKCDVFADYSYNDKEYINDRRFDLGLREIRKKFQGLAKQYMNENQLLGLNVTNALDMKSVEKAFDNCLLVVSMDKSKLLPSNPSLT